MSKKVIIVAIVVAIVVIGGGLLLFAPMHKAPTKTDTMDMHKSSQTDDKAVATNSVVVQDFAFSPANITVKKGTTVTWTNQDSAAHTVTETDGKAGPDSGDVAHGKAYSFTYDTVGTFNYNCSIHPEMTGTVTVTE